MLWSTHDAVIAGGFGYDKRVVSIQATGMPPPDCGDVAVVVHQGRSQSTMVNALNEYFSVSATLTMRVANVSWDRIGSMLLARRLQEAQRIAREIGFNQRAEALRAFLHQNWGVLQDANQYLVDHSPDGSTVYGFSEAMQYRGMEIPALVGPEWFSAEPGPDGGEVGLKSEMSFEGGRRLQAIASYV